MLNEGKGITDAIKDEINNIWNLFIQNSYSKHNLYIGNDKIGYKDYEIEFVERNNYYSNLIVDKYRNCKITIGIPINGKEKRVKEVVSHELTHLIEIIGLNKKDYPTYWNIKKSIINFKPKTKVCELIIQCIYKTLDNEINANVAQTYVYLSQLGIMSKNNYISNLKQYSEWIEYNNILNLDKNNIKSKVDSKEIEELNNILLKNNVKTIKFFDIDKWFNFWFRIFEKKSIFYLKKSERIIDEVIKKYKHFENYSTSLYDNNSESIDYTPYILDFNKFQNNIDK